MSKLRQWVTDLRRIATTPARRVRMRYLCDAGRAPIMVLFYHRVADTHPNDWTIPCDLFASQIEWMRERFEMIDMQEVQRRMRSGDSRRPAIHITFDDGYAENCRFALPHLIRHRIPCTYFVAYGHCQTGEPFQHDVANGVALPVNTMDELRAMADGGVEIGYHTRTHCDCGNLKTSEEFESEIVDGAAEMRAELGLPLRYFAFPFGMPQNIPVAGIQAVYKAGFEGFCSAYGAYNFPGQDSYHIRRLHGDPEFSRLKNWLTYDVRKVKQQREIRYWMPPATNWETTKDLVG